MFRRPFDGLGLRGNDSSPIAADGARVPVTSRLGEDGQGFDVMMGTVLPIFNILNAACSIGIMEAVVRRTAEHASGIHYAHLNSKLADLPTIRSYIARMRVRTDSVRALLDHTIAAVESGRPDAMLSVLSCKAAAGDAAIDVVEAGDARLRRRRIPKGSRGRTILSGCACGGGDGTDHGCVVRLHRQSRVRHAAILRGVSCMAPHSKHPDTLILGAVAYDQKVVAIWDGFQEYFRNHGLPFDYVLYSNYERQVEAHIAGHVHVAWNSPLAWLQTERLAAILGRKAEAICMRDTDRDLHSIVLVRSDSGITTLDGLKGKVVAVGAQDSPQATLIPLSYLADHGLQPNRDFEVQAFDLLVGKHGDHIGGEREAVRALLRSQADAACLIDSNHLAFAREGTLPRGTTTVLARTGAYDHCNFTALDDAPSELIEKFRALLLNMSYAEPEVRSAVRPRGTEAVGARTGDGIFRARHRGRAIRRH